MTFTLIIGSAAAADLRVGRESSQVSRTTGHANRASEHNILRQCAFQVVLHSLLLQHEHSCPFVSHSVGELKSGGIHSSHSNHDGLITVLHLHSLALHDSHGLIEHQLVGVALSREDVERGLDGYESRCGEFYLQRFLKHT